MTAPERPRVSPAREALVGLCIVALVVWIAYETSTWPDVAALARRTPRTTAFIELHRAREREARHDGRVLWTPVPYDAIAADLKRAVLVAEDISFFSHQGFAPSEMRSAVSRAIAEGELPRGASTITQQLAKNLWLSPSRNPIRKVKEAILTWQLEQALGKRRILELYLNVAEFGPGVYGAEAASRRYFGKPAAALDEEEAAQLAAGLSRPASWHPGVSTRAYRRHVDTILRRMAKADFLRRHLSTRDAKGGIATGCRALSPACAGHAAGFTVTSPTRRKSEG